MLCCEKLQQLDRAAGDSDTNLALRWDLGQEGRTAPICCRHPSSAEYIHRHVEKMTVAAA